ncbi:tetraacyldisaccharide 4'-kinase [Lacinutrix sp. 5H-3-7-4]|uniref:tetraacyldisaccharide 4'-kinase n=1 Tax=Lacinutrix sp. (strain 5H-3-7-4) TaxID=983544 RepID=UPI00020A35E2|nr:tetraacyldisaccharide 4'-kinase [Lacinutrix sp. 5H-3-7-4]AEH01294.1 Tetraacyldisaccharide 4'-kinase [Lacinutrix sp. 5H-3-7-4]
MKLIRLLLLPIVPIYFAITWFRNLFYDLGYKSSKSYTFPVLCVGNLSAGGTGKTPMVEYLIKLLKEDYKIATLSRGYGRKTKGFRLANTTTTALEIGDEPFQFYHKFKDDILVSVDENRQHGIEILRALKNKPEVVVLDDAFQHRKVKAGFNILLTTYNKPFYSDFVLPTGDLREPKNGAKRAQVIVVTKCPETINKLEKDIIISKIKPKPYQKVFFSSISYSEFVISNSKKIALQDVQSFTLVTGIANAKPLVSFLNKKQLKFNHLEFKDHYNFSALDIERFAKETLIITTEKDFVRLKDHSELSDNLYYLPITVSIDNSKGFNASILNFINRF